MAFDRQWTVYLSGLDLDLSGLNNYKQVLIILLSVTGRYFIWDTTAYNRKKLLLSVHLFKNYLKKKNLKIFYPSFCLILKCFRKFFPIYFMTILYLHIPAKKR